MVQRLLGGHFDVTDTGQRFAGERDAVVELQQGADALRVLAEGDGDGKVGIEVTFRVKTKRSPAVEQRVWAFAALAGTAVNAAIPAVRSAIVQKLFIITPGRSRRFIACLTLVARTLSCVPKGDIAAVPKAARAKHCRTPVDDPRSHWYVRGLSEEAGVLTTSASSAPLWTPRGRRAWRLVVSGNARRRFAPRRAR